MPVPIHRPHVATDANTRTRPTSPPHSPPTPHSTAKEASDFPPLPVPTNVSRARSVLGPKPLVSATNVAKTNGTSFAALLGGGQKPKSGAPSETSSTSPRPSNASAIASGRAAAPSPATPELDELAKYLEKKTNADTLRYCLGLRNFEDAPPLAERIVIICFDTEGWTADSAKITEVGFNTFDTRDTRRVKPGPHGENFMKQIFFYHIRVQPNAHLLNIKYCPGDPTANRFGQTRFLTKSETQGCLNDAFGWPLEPGKPELGLCPVIMLGHALGGDLDKLQNTLGWNPHSLGNIVKVLDTQQIIRDVGWWDKRDQIGLPAIVARCSFTYRNAHTASNDAAMTTIAAIQMALPNAKAWKEGDNMKPIQDVIDEVEAQSQKHNWTWGSQKSCLRCGSRDHMKEDPNTGGFLCRAPVRCEHCIAEGRHTASFSHVTERCIQYALAHGNSALAKKTTEEKMAKKSKYMRRFTHNGMVAKPAIASTATWRALGARVVSEPPPAPYGPGGLFGPPLESADKKPAIQISEAGCAFGSKLPGPFGNKTIRTFGRKPSDLSSKPAYPSNKPTKDGESSEETNDDPDKSGDAANGGLNAPTNKAADFDRESSDSDTTLIGVAQIGK